MQIFIKRKLKVNADAHLVFENANDWMHFAFVHRRSHSVFKPLVQVENRTIFFYKARLLYPFPFFRTYLVVRQDEPEQKGYQQIYLGLNGEVESYLKARCYIENGVPIQEGRFLLQVHWYLKPWPKLFASIFRVRMYKVALEDNDYLVSATPINQKENSRADISSCFVDEKFLEKEFSRLNSFVSSQVVDFSFEQETTP